ncbi:MAG: hypothetical protein LH465_05355 [Sphingomonas bacterium]|nr:hypothetical protein [Sphingomonas bacterium]
MPLPDPAQPPSIKHSFRRIMRIAALFSAVIAVLAMVIVSRGETELHLHMLIATGVGILLTMLLGTGLMTLMFLSNRHGHDADAHRPPHEPDQKDPT